MKVAQFQFVVVWFLCLRLSAASAEEAAPQWSQFRGPGGQGIASGEAKLPVEFGPSKNVLWKTPVVLGHSSPCVWENRLFLTGADAKERKLFTVCLDRADGSIIWQKSVTVDKLEALHRLNGPASSSPATDGRHVYVYFGSFGLLAYDLDGNEKWKRPLSATPSWFGSGTSPVVAGDRVLLNCGTQGSFSLLAIDPASGKTLWQRDRPQGFATGQWSTPVVRQTTDGAQEVFVAGGMHCSAYSLEDGTERWTISGLPAISLNTAAVGDGLIFFSLTNPFGEPDNILQLPGFDEALAKYDGNADGKIAANEVPADLMLFVRGRADKIGDWSPLRGAVGGHDADQDGSLNKEEWQKLARQQSDMAARVEVVALAVRPGGAVNQHTGEIAWKQTTAVPEVPSLLHYDHRIYLVSEKGILTCRDAASGKELYKQRLGVEGTCYASPVVGDDKIYVASDGGTIIVFKPGDQYQLCAKNAFDEGIVATPALVDGTIYVRTRGHLYACAAPAQRAIPSLEPYPLASKARQALVELAGKSDILILGEIHGTQEVPAIAVALLEPLAKQGYRTLALEIPSDQQGALTDWATGKTDTIPSFFAEPSGDGRGNVQVLSLIRSALSPPFGWRLICFDQDEADEATAAEDETADWIQRDAKMAANLMTERSRLAPDSKVLAICGNLHARTSNTVLAQKNPYKQAEDAFGKLWPSFAARLRSDLAGRQVRSINVVRSERKIDEADAHPLDKQWYDWELNLPRATPATFLTPPKNPYAIQTAKTDVRLVWFPRFSPDSKWLITAHGSWDAKEGGEVRVWETETGNPKFTIPTERGVRTVAWAPKGEFFVSGDYGGKVLFYDAETGEQTGKIQLPRNVEVLQIAPDEKRLYAASGDGSVRICELPSRKELYTWKALHKGNIWGMALSPDGRKLCTGGKDDFAHLLDVETFGVLHDLAHPADVNGVVFTGDGKHVLTGCGDAAIRVFDVESGKEVGRLGGHKRGSVTDLCFAPGGKLLASCGMDGSVRLWDFADFVNPKLTESLDGANDLVFGVAISSDGKRLAFGGWSDQIRVIDLDTHEAKWSWQAKGKKPDPDPAAVADQRLRQELLDREEKDQCVRKAAMKQKPSEAELMKMEQVDRQNTAWLKKVVDERGWPGKGLVGEDGAHAAWLLVQHADRDLAFQKKCLGLLTVAVKKGDASAQDMAYLVDRVRAAEEKPQVYGTQLDLLNGALKPKPIEDEEHVDERRKEVGLPPLGEYLKFAEGAFSPTKDEP